MTATPDPVETLWESASTEATWGGRVRGLAAADRARLLARADVSRTTVGLNDPGRDRARACYAALADDLDPASASDLERIRHFFQGAVAIDAVEHGSIGDRIADVCADRGLALDAALLCAQRDGARGRLDAAERRLRALLDDATVDDDRRRGRVVMMYAVHCGRSKRDLEALVLARRAVSMLDRGGDVNSALHARYMLAHQLADLEDWPRAGRVLDEIEAIVPSLSAGHRAVTRLWLHTRRAHAHRVHGRWEEALEEIAAAEELGVRTPSSGWNARWVSRMRALAYRGLGRVDDAWAAIGQPSPRDKPDDASSLDVLEVRLLLDVDQASPRALDEAAAFLDRVEAAPRGQLSTGARLGILREVAPALARVPALAAAARRAYDLAASAAIERLAEVDRFVRDHPDVANPTTEDLSIFAEFRRRKAGEHADLRAAVSRWLVAEAQAGRWRIDALAPASSDLVVVCAWCNALRTRAGAWIPLPDFLPIVSEGPIRVTHGMCMTCRRAIEPRLALRRA